ncbi:oligosaccharide flippase family protein [Variovorax sp. UC122_21]|uniref:oligosaccharide flippase family protein n=1 Tax=Variovorax sp. UC122_21 TaxID=3374554 RepID=UPI0037562D86
MLKKFRANKDFGQLLKNIVALGILRGLDLVIPLLVLPYLIRVVGIDNFGLLAFSLSTSAYFGAVMQFGFSITAARDVARAKANQAEVEKIFSVTLFASLILALACVIAFSILVAFVPAFGENRGVFFSSMFLITMQSLLPVWLFQGLEKMQFITALAFTSKLIYVGALFLMVKQPHDYIFVHLLNGAAAAIVFFAAISIARWRFSLRIFFPGWREILTAYKHGYDVFIGQLAPNLYNNSANFLLGVYWGKSAVGVFSAAAALVDAANSVGRIVCTAYLPLLSRDIRKFKAFKWVMLGLGALLSIALFILSPVASSFLVPKDSDLISKEIRWLAPSIIFAFLYLTYGTNYLNLVGLAKVGAKISVRVSLVCFFIGIFVIPKFGVMGAIALILVARFLMAMSVILFSGAGSKTNI